MKDENKVVESFDRALASLVARLSPEQRLAGLTEAEAVLVLPDAALRGPSNVSLTGSKAFADVTSGCHELVGSAHGGT